MTGERFKKKKRLLRGKELFLITSKYTDLNMEYIPGEYIRFGILLHNSENKHYEYFPSSPQQQQQRLAEPPQQTKTDAVVEEQPARTEDLQEETPMEQENPEGEISSVPSTEDTSEKEENQDTVGHAKMPEHPGRDSDSDGEDSGEEQ